MKIRIFGLDTVTGVGIHSRNIYKCLRQLEDENISVEWISWLDKDGAIRANLSSHETDLNIFFFYIEDLSKFFKGKSFFWYVFETTKPAANLEKLQNQFDYLITSSEWGKKCLIENGFNPFKITVIPEGVNPWKFHPFFKKQKLGINKKIFLMIGKFENRKGYYEAIQAFSIAHESNKDLELWIKADIIQGQESIESDLFVHFIKDFSRLPIRYFSGITSISEIRNLYYTCDYFLFPSKGEGWGLSLIEAIACGTPVICSNHSGQSEYLKLIPEGYISLPYMLKEVNCEIWKRNFPQIDNYWGKWAEFDIKLLSDIIIDASKNDFKSEALKSSEIIRNEFSWEKSTFKLIKFLNDIS